MTYILGCDPGLKGAFALLQGDKLVNVWDMPKVPKTTGKGNEISVQLLNNIMLDVLSYINQKDSTLHAIIETVRAMPGQGVTSCFSFGRSLGVMEGVIAGHQIPINYVTPQRWKKYFGLIKKEKDASRGLVLSKFPDRCELFKRKLDCDRAEAVLIGLYEALK